MKKYCRKIFFILCSTVLFLLMTGAGNGPSIYGQLPFEEGTYRFIQVYSIEGCGEHTSVKETRIAIGFPYTPSEEIVRQAERNALEEIQKECDGAENLRLVAMES